jgi:hypothetical protein
LPSGPGLPASKDATLFEIAVNRGYRSLAEQQHDSSSGSGTGVQPLQFCHKTLQAVRQVQQVMEVQDQRLAGFCLLNIHTRSSVAMAYLDVVRDPYLFNPYKQGQVIHAYLTKLEAHSENIALSQQSEDATAAEAAQDALAKALNAAKEQADCVAGLLHKRFPRQYPDPSDSSSPPPSPGTEPHSGGSSSVRSSRVRAASVKAAAAAAAAAAADKDTEEEDAEQLTLAARPKAPAKSKSAAAAAAAMASLRARATEICEQSQRGYSIGDCVSAAEQLVKLSQELWIAADAGVC